jgi:hypothetical protein
VHGANVSVCAHHGRLPAADLDQCDTIPCTALLSDSAKSAEACCTFLHGKYDGDCDVHQFQSVAQGQHYTDLLTNHRLGSCSALESCPVSGSAAHHGLLPMANCNAEYDYDCAWRLHAEECRHAHWIKVFVWHTNTERAMHVFDCPRYSIVWLRPGALVKDLKNKITESFGLEVADLFMASTQLVHHEIDARGQQGHYTQALDASGGAARVRTTGGVTWGRLRMTLMSWDDDLPLRTGARICSGAHVLSLSRDHQVSSSRSHRYLENEGCGEGEIHIAASDSMHVAAAGSPVSFVVSINHPRTQDFSIDLVAHPWTTLGKPSISVVTHACL